MVKKDVSEEYDVISNLVSVINFNKSLNNLALILNKIPSFSQEFHCVMSVRRMSEFILTEEHFTNDYFDFLLCSVDQFIKIIEFKFNNLSGLGSDSSKKQYKKLSREFLKSEKFFYTKVYKSFRNHNEDFFRDMIRLLVR